MQRFLEVVRTRIKDEPIMRLADLIDWQPVEDHMKGEYWREFFSKGGRTPYDHRAMFRALLIARWHGFSYQKLERALRVRLDFLLFCGFDVGGKLPDSCTLNRFNARLSADGALDEMVAEVENQLDGLGFELRLSNKVRGDLVLHKLCGL